MREYPLKKKRAFGAKDKIIPLGEWKVSMATPGQTDTASPRPTLAKIFSEIETMLQRLKIE
jgi:hypothetical protein